MAQSDKELLAECRRGDESAWEALVKRYQRLIYTISRRAGLDAEQSAEVFQDVFMTLLERLDSIEQPERLQAWLVTTARRKSLRVLYNEKSLQPLNERDEEDEEAIAERADEALLPDEVLMRIEEQHRVRTAVESLDKRCRQLLSLLFYSSEPLSYAEVAQAMGTSEGSIGPTRARCLKKLVDLI